MKLELYDRDGRRLARGELEDGVELLDLVLAHQHGRLNIVVPRPQAAAGRDEEPPAEPQPRRARK